VTPPELELIASEQLIDIVPLVTMEKTAFISVSTIYRYPLRWFDRDDRPPAPPIIIRKGCLWSVTPSSESSSPVVDSCQPQVEEEMSHRSTGLALSWYRVSPVWIFFFASWRLTEGYILGRIPSRQVDPRNFESWFQSTPVPIRGDLEGHPGHVSRCIVGV